MEDIGLPEAFGPPDGSRNDGGTATCAAEQRRALDDAWVRMHDKLRRAARNVLRDGHAAEDAAHDAFLAAFQGMHALRDPDRIDAWLMRITKNVAMTHRKRTQRQRPWLVASGTSLLDAEGMADAPWERLCSQEPAPETVLELRAAIDRLPPEWRETFRARVIEGRRIREIALDHGVTEACVKTRLARVWKRLRAAVARGT